MQKGKVTQLYLLSMTLLSIADCVLSTPVPILDRVIFCISISFFNLTQELFEPRWAEPQCQVLKNCWGFVQYAKQCIILFF